MIKFQNDEGEILFEIKDDECKPTYVGDEENCPKCHQAGEGKSGVHPCPLCGRNLLHDEDKEEE